MKNLRLKAARAAKDLSQQALAEKVGVTRRTINGIEQGDYNPTIVRNNAANDVYIDYV